MNFYALGLISLVRERDGGRGPGECESVFGA